MTTRVTVAGAGLAGCEAAWQLVRRGVPVRLVDMKPARRSPAHSADGFAELVCSNSLKAEQLTNASGLLKAEMRALGSLILRAAENSRVPAGSALAVDRERFSEFVTRTLKEHPLIEFETALVDRMPEPPAIVATGPLTDPALADALTRLPGLRALHFFDAAAPIVTAESIDMDRVFRASRYGKGSDYLNCPMTEAEYNAFYDALVSAELAELHDFEKNLVFEGCLAVEILARRGRQTLAFGPLKPVGLTDPRTGKEPCAIVQLRQENESGTLYNLVGFQTRLKWGEQKRVFSMIPGLENAEFARYGVMHRNTYLNAPRLLAASLAVKQEPRLFVAGVLAGTEGYLESSATGWLAGTNAARTVLGLEPVVPPAESMLGGLTRYLATANPDGFQPMNANWGLVPELPKQRGQGRRERREAMYRRGLQAFGDWLAGLEGAAHGAAALPAAGA